MEEPEWANESPRRYTMTATTTRFEILQIQTEGNRLVIPVTWRQAESLQNHLRQKGIGSTLCLVPYTDEARLEVWPGSDAAAVRAALAFAEN
jgi:hypothetical protein